MPQFKWQIQHEINKVIENEKSTMICSSQKNAELIICTDMWQLFIFFFFTQFQKLLQIQTMKLHISQEQSTAQKFYWYIVSKWIPSLQGVYSRFTINFFARKAPDVDVFALKCSGFPRFGSHEGFYLINSSMKQLFKLFCLFS